MTVRRVGDVQWVMSAYHVPSGADPDFAALDLVVLVLGDTPAGRLHKALVETKQASQTFGGNFQLHDPGTAYFAAQVRQDQSLDTARDGLLKIVEAIATTPPTAEELERARTNLLTQIELQLNSSDRVGLQLSEWIGMGDWRLLFLHRDRLRTVTADDARRVAAKYFKPSNRTVGLFIPTPQPDRVEMPPKPDLVSMLKDYKGGAVVAAGEAFDPSPKNIESRTARSPVGGLKLSLLPKQTRGDTVVANLTLRFGDEKSLTNRSMAGQFAGAMLMRGTTKRTRQQIQDEIDRLKARVNVFGGPTNAGAQIETTRENLPAVLASRRRDSAESRRSRPTNSNNSGSSGSPGSSRPRASRRPSVSSSCSGTCGPTRRATSATCRRSRNRSPTSKPSRSTKRRSSIRTSTAPRTASSPSSETSTPRRSRSSRPSCSDRGSRRVRSRASARPTGTSRRIDKSLETPDKANAVFMAGINLNVQDTDPDYAALVLGNYMLGGGFLNSRLATRVRQKEGLSYGISSQFQASSLDRTGVFMVQAIYAPQNAARLEAAIKEELTRALADGFTDDEVKAAKAGWLQSNQVTRAQDGSLAGRLNTVSYINRTLALGRGTGIDRRGLDAGRNQGRAREAHLAGEDQFREGGGLREGCGGGQVAPVPPCGAG